MSKFVQFVWFKNVDHRICVRLTAHHNTESHWTSTIARVIRLQTRVLPVSDFECTCARDCLTRHSSLSFGTVLDGTECVCSTVLRLYHVYYDFLID